LIDQNWSHQDGLNHLWGESNPEPSINCKEADICKEQYFDNPFFVPQYIFVRKDKSSCLTHKTLNVAEEPLHFGGHFGHLHKVVLVELPYVLFLKVAGDSQNSLAFQLGCLTGMGKVTICISALFSLAS
jgi:hypothetical protein